MKKIILLVLIAITELSLVGCISYFDETRKDMELIAVKVYDKDGIEVMGKYKSYYAEILYEETSLNSEIIPLNSAAPVENYYFVDGVENAPYTVKLIFYSKKGYNMTKLLVESSYGYRNDGSNTIETSNITKEDENIVVTLDIERVSKENCLYTTIKWYENDVLHTFHTKGSNTYIKGVYFRLPSLDKVSC